MRGQGAARRVRSPTVVAGALAQLAALLIVGLILMAIPARQNELSHLIGTVHHALEPTDVALWLSGKTL